jgi:hypothetical protein
MSELALRSAPQRTSIHVPFEQQFRGSLAYVWHRPFDESTALEYSRRRARGLDSTDIRKRLPLVSRVLLDVYWDFYFGWIMQTRPRIVSAQTQCGEQMQSGS